MNISVVIPVYNDAVYLDACLRSLRAQSQPPHEIIVVDNNSTDDTPRIAKLYGARLLDEPCQGIGYASRTGMNAACGDVIARCDADSRLPTDWLATIEQQLTAHPQAVAVTGPGTFYGTNRITAGAAKLWYMYAYFVLVGSALATWPLFGSNYAIRRQSWRAIRDAVHYDRNDIHDDIDVTAHLPLGSKILFSRQLTASVSARALTRSNLRLRYSRGMRSLTIHWPVGSPTARWRAKFML